MKKSEVLVIALIVLVGFTATDFLPNSLDPLIGEEISPENPDPIIYRDEPLNITYNETIRELIMPKATQFAEVTVHADNTLKNVDSIRNIGYYDSKYWWAEYARPAYARLVIKSCPSNNFNVAATTEHYLQTSGDTSHGTITENSVMLRIFGDEIYAVYIFRHTDGADDNLIILMSYSTDGGASWTDVRSGGLYSAQQQVVDFIQHSDGSVYYIKTNAAIGAHSVNMLPITGGGEGGYYNDLDDFSAIYSGPVIGTKWYFVVYTDTHEWKLFSFHTGVGEGAPFLPTTEETLTGLTLPSSWDVSRQMYWQIGNSEYIIDIDNLNMRVGSLPWAVYTTSATTAVGAIWDNNATTYNYEINYFIYDDKIFKVFTNGAIMRIAETAVPARVGYDNWYVDPVNGKIYQASIATLANVQNCTITEKLYTPPRCDLALLTEPVVNQGYMIYDENSNLQYVGFIESYDFDREKYTSKMRSLIQQDYDTKVEKDYTTQTTHAILKDIIDTYCSFLFYTTNINTTPATTYSISFRSKTVLDVIKWCGDQVGYVSSVRPSGEVYYDQMTDSTKSITYLTDLMDSLKYRKFPLKLTHIVIYGGWNSTTGKRWVSEIFGEPNYGEFSDWYPQIQNQTDLDAIRDAVLAQKNIEIEEIQLKGIRSKNPIYVGQTYSLTATADYGITGDTHYTNETKVDLSTTMEFMDLTSTSALYIPPQKSLGVAQKLNNLNQYTDDVNNKVDSIVGGSTALTGTTNSSFQLDSDSSGVLLKDVSGHLEVKHHDDASYEAVKALTYESTVTTGTAPLTIASTTPVDNLSIYADQVIIPNGEGTPSYDDLQDFLRMTRSAGRLTGGVISAHNYGSDTLVNITELEGMIFTTNALGGSYVFFKKTAEHGLDLSLIDKSVSWVYYDYTTATYAATTTRSDIHEYDQFSIGRVFRDGNNVAVLVSGHSLYDKDRRSHNRLILKYGSMDHRSGGIIAATTAGGPLARGLYISDGSWYIANTPYTTTSVDTGGGGHFHTYYRSGAATWTESGELTQVPNTQYNRLSDNSLQNLTSNRFGVYWVYLAPDGKLLIVYGQGDYTSAQAIAAPIPSAVPPICLDWSQLVGKIIIQKSATAFTSIESTLLGLTLTQTTATWHPDLSGRTEADSHPIGAISTVAGANVLIKSDGSKLTAGTVTDTSGALAAVTTINHSGAIISASQTYLRAVATAIAGINISHLAEDTTALAIDNGACIALEGIYTGTTQIPYAAIKGGKLTAVDGEYGGYCSIYASVDGVGLKEVIRATTAMGKTYCYLNVNGVYDLQLIAAGSPTDINISITPKGAGTLQLGTVFESAGALSDITTINHSGAIISGSQTYLQAVATAISGANVSHVMQDTTALGIDNGACLALEGIYTGTTQIPYAAIKGGKETATDGEYGGYCSIYASADGVGLTEVIRARSTAGKGYGYLIVDGSSGVTLSTDGASLSIGDGSSGVCIDSVFIQDQTISGVQNIYTSGIKMSCSELTISGGAITPTGSNHTVDTESDAASDNLDTIGIGSGGDILILHAAHTDRTVVVKNLTGNIYTGGADISLDNTEKTITLIYDLDLALWLLVGGSGGGSGGDLKADGTVPLTADWDAGAYEIRAQTFESDVATGTAPFVVASETKVNNLYVARAALADTATAAASQAIADNSLITADAADIADDEYARFTANGLESRTKAEVATDLKDQFPQAITDNHVVTIDDAGAADDEYARFTANGLEGRTAANVLSDIAAAPLASPTFTGTPSLPTGTIAVTQAAGTNSTQIATMAALAAACMIGSANSAFVPCIYEADNGNFVFDDINIAYGQVITHGYIAWRLPLPCNRGGLKLHIASARLAILYADASDYVTQLRIYGIITATGLKDTVLVDDGTNQTSAGMKAYAFADVDVSAYDSVILVLNCIRAANWELMLHGVTIECYYDT